MEEYAGRVLADRYRLPRVPVGEEPAEMPAFDTYSGQEVLARQVPLPEVVSAEVLVGPGEGEEPPDVLAPADDPGRRALRAATVAAGIPDHPRLVQVYDVFLDGGSLWIISEWVSATPLAAVIDERKLSPYRAAEIGADVLTALRAVHTHGWTHRNVTAQTVLVCDDGRAILTGLAAAAAEEAICGYDPVPTEVPDSAAVLNPAEGLDPAGRPGPAGGVPEAFDGLTARPKPLSGPARERARQVRVGVIGACTERWAPEQAGPLPVELPSQNGLPDWAEPVSVPHEHTDDGPPSDLWALGALLFRAIQGHPPFPEDNAHELIDLVRTEPPAFAEECGPLRPIVESLMRKDPQTRPDPEEVTGWLRSLIRAAPEPDIGRETIDMPADDAHKVVEIRRRGDVARRRQGALVHHGKHARSKKRKRSPRWLGMFLVGGLMILVAIALVAAGLMLPKDPPKESTPSAESSPSGAQADVPTLPPGLSTDVSVYRDPDAGFQLLLHNDLRPKGTTPDGQVWFEDDDDVDMIVAPGLDTVERVGEDLEKYQRLEEPELQEYRDGKWTAVFGVDELDLNGSPAIKGEFSWRDEKNVEFYARNLVILHDGKYHVVLVKGPKRDRSVISQFFEKAAGSYRVTK